VIRATATIDPERTLGRIDPMIYGQYLEHVQPEHHCIYGAIQDEGSPLSDKDGFRLDVIDLVRELDVPVVRWPGGCFADIYHWEDGIGPRDARPARRNWHWHGLETNRFGTDEFLTWVERIDSRAYLNLNFGTGTLDEAVRWLDYCNGTEPTHEVQLRQQNGRQEPWNVPFWGVGNEQWGPWEAGHMDAATYAEQLRNWTQFLKKLDPAASFLGIGSHSAGDPKWDLETLLHAGHLIDWLTLHAYGHSIHDGTADDYYPTVNFAVFFEERLKRMIGILDAANSILNKKTPVRISLDEWNIRHLVTDPATGKQELDRMSPRTVQDAVTAAGVLHAMLRHPDKIGMANYVFLLNGNGVILVNPEGTVKTPLFDIFSLYHKLMTGDAIDVRVASDTLETTLRAERFGQERQQVVELVDVVATRQPDSGAINVAIVNRHRDDPAEITLDGLAGPEVTIHELTHANPLAANTFEQPDNVRATTRTAAWTGSLSVPAHSVTLLEFGNERQ